jgi:hypothetical protein
MTDDERLVDGFYADFARRDGAAMQARYASDARFSDPVFTGLTGPQVGAMWRMLCERAGDLRLEWRDVREDAPGRVQAHWEAWYTFSATGRRVHNVIDARFVVRDGRIVEHADRFDFWRWSRQALGAPGWLLGWTPPLRAKVQAQAARGLAAYQARQATPGA